MSNFCTRLAVSAVTLGALTAGLLVAPASAAPTDVEFDGGAFAAPAQSSRGAGGVTGAFAYCGDDDEDDPSTYTVVVKQGTRTVASRSGDRAYDFVRVAQGSYQVTTTAACGGAAKSRTDSVTVGRLKDSETVSKGEYRKIKKGQTLAKIARTIGGKPERLGKRNGRAVYMMPTTTFGGYSIFEFKGKKLKKKDRVNAFAQ